MGKLKKAGKEGAAQKYINRNRALKKLQVSLPNFRRLCILKGIYPVEPKNRKKVNKGSTAPTTFYYTKDIQFLMHEPLLLKFREHKIYKRKLRHAIRKQEWTKAKSIRESRPTYSLDHLVIERYPTFQDALRDLDDAISMLSLFASLPSTKKAGSGVLSQCKRLYYEFLHYIMYTHSLSKVFLSIKGIYYQAVIRGQPITWVAPYEFRQKIPSDVDFRVMWSFLEFYRNLIGFVNCKLYRDEKLVYPPQINKKLDDLGVGLGALALAQAGRQELLRTLESIDSETPAQTAHPSADLNGSDQSKPTNNKKSLFVSKVASLAKKLDSIAEHEESLSNQDTNNTKSEDSESGNESTEEADDLDSEVPRYSLEFVIRAFGGKVCWDGYFNGELEEKLNELDPRINIFVVDRPSVQKSIKNTKKTLVQPQFVYDSANAKVVLSFSDYAVGKKLPPHLSPFVEYKEGDYVPKQQLVIEEYAKSLGFKGTMDTLSQENTIKDIKEEDKPDSNEDSDDGGELDYMSADESEEEESTKPNGHGKRKNKNDGIDSEDDEEVDSELEELIDEVQSGTESEDELG
ncbi:hypothetical protein BB560_006128, partial [Smittium megazygosporum]